MRLSSATPCWTRLAQSLCSFVVVSIRFITSNIITEFCLSDVCVCFLCVFSADVASSGFVFTFSSDAAKSFVHLGVNGHQYSKHKYIVSTVRVCKLARRDGPNRISRPQRH